ncbi:MAG: hypothetical protein ACI906_002490 [Candidatus Latescibacterota bacterium]|jgi:hypothetical protein
MIGMRVLKGVVFVGLLVLAGCGDDKADTPYGDEEVVSVYRSEINSAIDEVNAVEGALREMAVGSTGKATGENLAAACLLLEARLVAVLVQLDAIAPPRKLSGTHADMRAAIELRREACEKIAAGWQVEQEQSFELAEPIYEAAEMLLSQAREKLALVDEVLGKVDVALGVEQESNPTG